MFAEAKAAELDLLFKKYQNEQMRRREISQHAVDLCERMTQFQESVTRLRNHVKLLDDDESDAGPAEMGFSYEGESYLKSRGKSGETG
mmetsp:Transcript_27125/g.75820  ORF Transcript_27125/g.75820 Transcript_27125/m.75820 type:complete len:88 (-) Transcript_27125:165-428(-)